ncbi:MAG: hypothetical protein JNK82_03155 [Myxococcaceae bacterium]|nr:hypothetical protein [Myxococcaceae bacterium]
MGDESKSVVAADDHLAAEELERRVALIRENMTEVVHELDYRRSELHDVQEKLKKRTVVAAVGGGVLVAASAALGFSVYRSRTRRPRSETARALIAPQLVRVTRYESLLHKFVSAAAGALVTMAVKAVALRLMPAPQPAAEAE